MINAKSSGSIIGTSLLSAVAASLCCITPVIEKIYADLFLSISSYKDLTTKTYNKVEDQIQHAGEKYAGKGKMPHIELCVASDKSCKKDKSCSKESGKSCCDKD